MWCSSGRFVFALCSRRLDRCPGAPPGTIEVRLDDTAEEQAAAAAAWIRATARREGLDWDAFGLVFRSNNEARFLEQALEAEAVPFTPASAPDPDAGDPPPERAPGRASLLTVHKAKGCEFPYLVYFNLSRRSRVQELEDERRVVYVGVTRAERGLLITAARGRPAGFLLEYALNPDFSDFSEAFLERRLRATRLKALWSSRRSLPALRLWYRPFGRTGRNRCAAVRVRRLE